MISSEQMEKLWWQNKNEGVDHISVTGLPERESSNVNGDGDQADPTATKETSDPAGPSSPRNGKTHHSSVIVEYLSNYCKFFSTHKCRGRGMYHTPYPAKNPIKPLKDKKP